MPIKLPAKPLPSPAAIQPPVERPPDVLPANAVLALIQEQRRATDAIVSAMAEIKRPERLVVRVVSRDSDGRIRDAEIIAK